jgi:uncharacterized protein YbjT (DUF2867 family)
MKAFVVGATGGTGKWIVRELVDKNIPVVALVRNREKGQQTLPAGVEIVVGDVLQPETLEAAIADCDVIICATGAAPGFDPTAPYRVDYEGTKNLVNLAKSKGISHFIFVSSLCVSQLLHPLNLFWLILVWKKQAEDYLRQSGVNYTIVRPGGLKNEDNTNSILMASADTLFDGSIPRQKVAKVCVEALFQPNAKNKTVEVITKAEAPESTWERLFTGVL